MVKETRYIFDLSDLDALRFRCGGETCNHEVVMLLNNGGDLPFQCPSCGKQWYTPGPGNNLSAHLLELLRKLSSPHGGTVPVDIRVEIIEHE